MAEIIIPGKLPGTQLRYIKPDPHEPNGANDETRNERRQYEFVPASTKGLVILSGAELLQKEFPPREMILGPWLPQKGSAMIFAERGIGKTWIALNIAHAVSGGGSFLRWRAPFPRRVVYIDGEMPAAVIKDRYVTIVAGARDNASIAIHELLK